MKKEKLIEEFSSLFFCSKYMNENRIFERIFDLDVSFFSLKERSIDDIFNDLKTIDNSFSSYCSNPIAANIYPVDDCDDYI